MTTKAQFDNIIDRNKSNGYLITISMQNVPQAFQRHASESAKEDVFMGFEWEVGMTSPTDYILVKKAMNLPIAQWVNFRGGGNPLEMVSIPATMKFLREMMQKEFFAHDLNKDFTNTNGCGIHIHISKKAFTEASLKKFIAFVVNPENRTFIEAIGGRSVQPGVSWCRPNLCEFKHFKMKKDMPSTGKLRIRGAKIVLNEKLEQLDPRTGAWPSNLSGKGVAVNTHTGYGTVEFRIFKAYTGEQKFMKNLEFTDALVRYVRKAAYNKLYAQDFVRFLLKDKENYQYLLKEDVVVGLVKLVEAEDAIVALKPKKKLKATIKEKIKRSIDNAKVLYKSKVKGKTKKSA